MHDPALVALSLEVCNDALGIVQKSGTETMAVPLRRAILLLLRRLNRIEMVNPAPAGADRPKPAGGAAVQSNP